MFVRSGTGGKGIPKLGGIGGDGMISLVIFAEKVTSLEYLSFLLILLIIFSLFFLFFKWQHNECEKKIIIFTHILSLKKYAIKTILLKIKHKIKHFLWILKC